jgi:Leucine-rich repeat (LRR) protein
MLTQLYKLVENYVIIATSFSLPSGITTNTLQNTLYQIHRNASFCISFRKCIYIFRDLGCGLRFLNVLKVSRCGLQSLDGTFGLTSLRELHASHNMVDDVGPCASLPHIRIIDLRK